MKIAVITSSLPPHPVGGAERQALETAKRLAARGHEVVVFARRVPADSPRRVEENGVTWVRAGTVDLPGLRFLAHAANFLRDWRAEGGAGFDLVLAFQLIINGFLGQTTAFRKSKIKKSVTIMGDIPGTDYVKYIHGNLGKGTFTFYAGHDPEDYQHFVNDPPTQLALHKNSPGYRLILNNILFPAAKKEKQKT